MKKTGKPLFITNKSILFKIKLCYAKSNSRDNKMSASTIEFVFE